MIGATVTLNEVEQRLCRFIARSRFEANRKKGVTNAKIGDQDNEQTDLEGVGAEVAFCKIMGVYPSGTMDISPRSSTKGEDNDGDVVCCGKRIDVKSTRYATGRLVAAPWKHEMAVDAYVLMTGVFPNYIYRGSMEAKELISPKRLGTLGHGPTYIAEQSDLVEL